MLSDAHTVRDTAARARRRIAAFYTSAAAAATTRCCVAALQNIPQSAKSLISLDVLVYIPVIMGQGALKV